MKPLKKGIRLRWEKRTARGVRYYEVDLHQDLWGEWLLTQAWGRLGQVRALPCGSQAEGLARVVAILKRRRQRCYVMVAGTDPHEAAHSSFFPPLGGGTIQRFFLNSTCGMVLLAAVPAEAGNRSARRVGRRSPWAGQGVALGGWFRPGRGGKPTCSAVISRNRCDSDDDPSTG